MNTGSSYGATTTCDAAGTDIDKWIDVTEVRTVQFESSSSRSKGLMNNGMENKHDLPDHSDPVLH